MYSLFYKNKIEIYNKKKSMLKILNNFLIRKNLTNKIEKLLIMQNICEITGIKKQRTYETCIYRMNSKFRTP